MCFGNEAFYGLLYINIFWSGFSILGVTIIQIFAVLLLPVALVKSGISLVHLFTASQTIAEHDVNERAKIAQKVQ